MTRHGENISMGTVLERTADILSILTVLKNLKSCILNGALPSTTRGLENMACLIAWNVVQRAS